MVIGIRRSARPTSSQSESLTLAHAIIVFESTEEWGRVGGEGLCAPPHRKCCVGIKAAVGTAGNEMGQPDIDREKRGGVRLALAAARSIKKGQSQRVNGKKEA